MAAFEWPIELEEGSDFDLTVKWEDPDTCSLVAVSDYGAKIQVRNDPDDPTSLITGSVANGRITAATTEFRINLPAESVDAIKDLIDDCARYTFVVWPAAASPSANPRRLLNGDVDYSRSYTD